MSAHAYTFLHRGGDRAAVLPPAPVATPAPASGDDLVAAVVVASRHAAERLEQLADARECAIDCADRGAADAAGAAREARP